MNDLCKQFGTVSNDWAGYERWFKGRRAYERSNFGGTATWFGDQRAKAFFTVVVHCDEVITRAVSPPTNQRYGCSRGSNSNCSVEMYFSRYGCTILLTVVTLGP